MNKRTFLLLTACLSAPCFDAPGWAKDFQPLSAWEETKTEYAEKGLRWETVYTGEFWTNTQGGLTQKSTYLSNLDVSMTVDTAKAGLWPNGTFFIYGLSNSGHRKLSGELIGDLQAVSNIEAPRTTRLYELWYEHSFLEERLAILTGIHDYNSDFNVTEYGQLFINSSFGIMPTISSGARAGVFPLAAWGGRMKWSPQDPWQFLFGVYDGDPGDPDTEEHFSRLDWDSQGGAFLAGEAAYFYGQNEGPLPGAIKFGLWHNTGEFDDVADTDDDGNPVKRDGNSGGYVLLDQMLYRENTQEGLGTFLQIGGAPRRINSIDFYLDGGVHYRGLFPKRNQDETGLAVAYASVSDKLADAESYRDGETAVELTHRFHICDFFAVQPDLQYVIHPGAETIRKNALATGLRFELSI